MELLTSNPKIARLYDQVPEESLRRLRAFRQRYPMQSMTIEGRTWRFIDTREGERAVFIPAGGTTIAEVSFASLSHFAQHYRVISPDYPPIDTMQEFLDGSLQLLDRLGVGSFSAMGGSYGGWMVQSLVRHCPGRVHKAVLSVIGPPNPENSRQLAKMMPLFRIIPMFVLRAMISRSFTRMETSDIDDPDLELMWALIKEVMTFRVKRRDLIAAMKRLVDQT